MIRYLLLMVLALGLAGCASGDEEGEDVKLEDPTTVTARGDGNSYLVCPPGVCRLDPDRASPRFSAPADVVAAAWQRIVGDAARTELLEEDPEARVLHYRQVSRVFRFPDIISVKFLDEPDGGSSLAVLSRSLVGSYDFGVNRSRIEGWLDQLESELGTGT